MINNMQDYHEALNRITDLMNLIDETEDDFEKDALEDEVMELEIQANHFFSRGEGYGQC